MDKNWLIRTKSNHILGPISKEKAYELYSNGSIKPDDEICSGNGYWFFIREDDLVERFLKGSEVQGFNPISEAKDVITNSCEDSKKSHQVKEDITMVQGLNLSILQKPVQVEVSSEVPELTVSAPKKESVIKETLLSENKKKNKSELKLKSSSAKKGQLKKQGYLKYLGILVFLILILMIYYRKNIIHHFFDGELTLSHFSLIKSASAQENNSFQKKKLLDSSVVLEKITFRPVIGLEGFTVQSSFDIEQLTCLELGHEVNQLAVVLTPPQLINENFMIKLRDCVLNLSEGHPLKKWLKWMAFSKQLSNKEEKKRSFVLEVINSQFNLITDLKVKNEIITILNEIPDETISEKILRSYLYLMIGNITRSDNILKGIINTPPRLNWIKTGYRSNIYHKISTQHASQIFNKLSKHPADRRAFQLLALYFQSYYNEESILKSSDDVDTSDVLSKIELRYIKSIAPSFVRYLRLVNMNESQKFKKLRNLKFIPLIEQSYWYWPFMNIDPLVSEEFYPELIRLENEDQLWFIYLMQNEKLADLFSKKKGRSFLPGRRPFLKLSLNDFNIFMMSLYKLIELGDINEELVNKSVDYLIHE